MTKSQWRAFENFRTGFRAKVTEWSQYASVLQPLQQSAAADDTPPYPLETAVVYNRALDDITEQSDIRFIVIGDNPGKDEQLARNNRYLVGQSGKIADGFFRRTPELGADFRKNVIILNKTPVHSAKTAHLKKIQKADAHAAELIAESQTWMAAETAQLHRALVSGTAAGAPAPELWLVGYAELKEKGIFIPYRDTLAASYTGDATAWNLVRAYQHFSMNRFLIDLRAYQQTHRGEPVTQQLAELGHMHRDELFCAADGNIFADKSAEHSGTSPVR